MSEIVEENIPEDNPVIEKLFVYAEAHEHYIKTLDYAGLIDNKIHWGLKKILMIN